jgi:hypothetical protein
MLTLTVVAAFFLGMWLLGPGAATRKGALSKMDNKFALSKMDNKRFDITDPAYTERYI